MEFLELGPPRAVAFRRELPRLGGAAHETG
jgi:hypothetical protein